MVINRRQNYPNPFNPVTRIEFTLPEATSVKLVVYDLTGREVAQLIDERKGAGDHSAHWDAADQPSGIYLYWLTAGSYTEVIKMVLLK